LIVALGLALSLATAPHVETWDFILLAVPLCVWARAQPYPALTACVLLDAIELITHGQADPLILYMIVLIPFGVAAGVWASRNHSSVRGVPAVLVARTVYAPEYELANV
jgi:hypothetical protein